jgi:hypothetical protein
MHALATRGCKPREQVSVVWGIFQNCSLNYTVCVKSQLQNLIARDAGREAQHVSSSKLKETVRILNNSFYLHHRKQTSNP